MLSPPLESTEDFLREVATRLGFTTGEGWYALDDLGVGVDISKAGWLEQARELNAKAIFFVRDSPTALFFQLDADLGAETADTEEQIRTLHLEVWNTSWIPLFFVALPGELRVYSAHQKPIRDSETWNTEERWLARVSELSLIAEKLRDFSRANIETGEVFRTRKHDFNRENRVDQWLLKNLQLLRNRLQGARREKREYVHALIGRSIFIKYLEHRSVLVPEYFASVKQDASFRAYDDFLHRKSDTYQFFRELRKDFNGDLFPLSPDEESAISDPDVQLLRDFLTGQSLGDQPDLFFWAYRFDIIPVELISNIYEEFYHEHNDVEDSGTHYTPTPLVDFVLGQTLTPERLQGEARVLDPACGSGIFLVEAFKRIVYFESQKLGLKSADEMSREDLTKILTTRIVGVDVNRPAVQVAAFSIYLAFLNFLRPRDIRQHKQLPKLIHESDNEGGSTLFYGDTFLPTAGEKAELAERLHRERKYPGRTGDERMVREVTAPFGGGCFDVIVGNPPWGGDSPERGHLATRWCEAFRYPVGDRELSQCFIWRAHRLLSPGGEIGFLVSTGVFTKHHENSRKFRQQWLKRSRIRAVYNFAHVRGVFFRKQKTEAIAPFAAVFFAPIQETETNVALNNKVSYVSVKRSAIIERLQAVTIDKSDLQKARQSDFLSNDWLWKTLMWGGPPDVELIGELKSCYPLLRSYVSDYGIGYQEGGSPKHHSTEDLGVTHEIDTSSFSDRRELSLLLKPVGERALHRIRNKEVYQGPRLLVKRGVSRSGAKNGEIHARLAYDPFAFRHSIIGFRLDALPRGQHKVILAILLSSLAKYYHFLTCSTWGFWHYEIHEEEHLDFPTCLPPEGNDLHKRLVAAADRLNESIPGTNQFSFFSGASSLDEEVQKELDDAVFDLYDLSSEQRDLVRDMCEYTLDFFYQGMDSDAIKPPGGEDDLLIYSNAFLEVWRDVLAAKNMEIEARVYAPAAGLWCAFSFELVEIGTARPAVITYSEEWRQWLSRLGQALELKVSSHMFVDRVMKELTNDSMLIIKRAQRRLWTRSQARQDAREFLGEVFRLEWQRERRSV